MSRMNRQCPLIQDDTEWLHLNWRLIFRYEKRLEELQNKIIFFCKIIDVIIVLSDINLPSNRVNIKMKIVLLT